MRTLILVAACLLLGGCTSAIKLKNPQTGQTATCGPYPSTWTTPEREGRCLDDFERQGFVRMAE